MSNERLFVLGLDAADKDLVQQWAAEGYLPTFRRLMETALWGDVENPPGLEAGSCWPTFSHGLGPAKTGQYDGARRFDPSSYLHRNYRPEASRVPPIWTVLSNAGKLCGVIDVPYSYPVDEISGIKINDRGAHVPCGAGDTMAFRTHPADLAREIVELFGPDPAGGRTSDSFELRTADDYRWFRDIYADRIANKTELTLHYWRQRPWDFFLTVFTEAHCVGHRCWHIHDPEHSAHDPDLAAALGDPVKDIYVALDTAVKRLVNEAQGSGARVIVYLSHGMGPRHTATHLLDRILARLDDRRRLKQFGPLFEMSRAMWRALPGSARQTLKPLRDRISSDGFAPDRKTRRFLEVYANDRTGGIRVNLAGREPHGIVRREDYHSVCDELISDLWEVVNDETGEPLAAEIFKVADRYDGPYRDELPDILVTWNRSAPINRAYSPKIGRLDGAGIYSPRTGDHRPAGRFFALAPDWAPGQRDMPARAEDFAPTIARMFGVALANTEGRPIPELEPARVGVHRTTRADAPDSA